MKTDPIVLELRQRRLDLGLSVSELARRIGVDRAWLTKLESGRHSPTLHTLRPWLAALDLDLRTAKTRRARIVRQLRPCGTLSAARRHHVRGEDLDERCRAAQRKYDREYKAARRAVHKLGTSPVDKAVDNGVPVPDQPGLPQAAARSWHTPEVDRSRPGRTVAA